METQSATSANACKIFTLPDNTQKIQIIPICPTHKDSEVVHKSHCDAFKLLHRWSIRLILGFVYKGQYNLCNKLHDISNKVINGLIEIEKLYNRTLNIHRMSDGIEVTVKSDDLCVCVYFTIPPTHKKFETVIEDIYECTYYTLLTSGSKQIGWDFGFRNTMIPHKFNKIICDNTKNIEKCIDLIQDLCIITIEDVNALITENLAQFNM